MPGPYATDALASNLLSGSTLNAAGTTNGTVVNLDRPGEVVFELTTSTVTGTTPTLNVEIQGSDSSGFGTSVSYGRFAQVGANSNTTRRFTADIHHDYVRAVVVVGGTTPVYTGSTLVAMPVKTRWSRTQTA